MNTLLLLPDGVGVRNFVLGPFLRLAARKGEVHTLHLLPPEAAESYAAGLNGGVQWHRLKEYRERPLCFILRNCLSYSQGYWMDSAPMQWRWKLPQGGSWRTRAAVGTARVIGRAAATPRGIQTLNRLHTLAASRMPEVGHYRRLFQEIQPTVLFCSHQRPNDVLAPVIAAKSLGIPTATFIYSWDNLSSKGRIAAPFDHFLVWSDHMRGELLRYYPDIREDRVHIVGTPQFDPYCDESQKWSRDEFFRRVGADPDRRLICYSGGDCSISLEDQHHVRVLMELIREGRIRGNPQVLLRPAPIDDFSRYDAVRRDFPELIYRRPEWQNCTMEKWAASLPSAADVQLLANLTRYSDLNVNFSSTMTLDFAIHDKPVVNLAFDVTQPPPFGMPMFDFIQMFEHYRPVLKLQAARFARSRDELAEFVNAYLEDPSLDREGRRQFVELEVGAPIGQSSQLVVDTLERISL